MNKSFEINGIPVIHLEFLTKNELETANQILQGFEVVGVPFISVTQNAKKKQIVLNAHNLNDIAELCTVGAELKQLPEFSIFDIVARV